MARGINLTFRGNDEGARAQAEAVAKALDQLGVSADAVKFNFQNSQKGADSLFGSLKELRGEARQHERVFAYYGAQLASLTGTSRETATALAGLGIALGSGMWVAAAVEVVRLATHFGELGKAEEEASKKAGEAAQKTSEAYRELGKILEQIHFAGITDSREADIATAKNRAYEQRVEILKKIRDAESDLSKAEAEARKKQDPNVRWEAQGRVDALKKALAASYELERTEIDKVNRLHDEKDQKEIDRRDDEALRKQVEHDKEQDRLLHQRIDDALKAEQDYSEGLAKIQLERARKAKELADAMAAAEIAAANRKFEADYAAEERAEKKRIDDLAASTKHYAEAVGQLVVRLVQGQMTAKQVFASIAQMVLESLVKIAADKLAMELATHLAEKPVVEGDVMAQAAIAGASAAAQVASTPLFATAPAVASETAASIMGSMMPLASAASGYYRIPFDRPVYTHKDEQILPAEYAEGLRRLIENGSGGGGITVHVSALDGPSVERTLTRNDSAFVRAQRKIQRRRRG